MSKPHSNPVLVRTDDWLRMMKDSAPGYALVRDLRLAFLSLEEQFDALRRERDAIGATLGEPCAECGHIDWSEVETPKQCTCTTDGEGFREMRGCPAHDTELAKRQSETIYDMTVQLASLRHALTQVRAECDLPDHIAEFIGEALASAAGVHGHA